MRGNVQLGYGKAKFRGGGIATPEVSVETKGTQRAQATTLIPLHKAAEPLLLKSRFYGQGPRGITLAQKIFTWRQIRLCLLLSDKCSCQGFVFCNISLSYLVACFDFCSSVGRKTAKT